MLSKKNISLIIGSAISLVFLASIPGAVENISATKDRQIAANSRLAEWKAAYQALLPVNAKWEMTFTSAEKTNDLVELYRAFKLEQHNLLTDADTIMQTGAHTVDVQGVSVGLQRLCIGNSPDALTLRAHSMADLRGGLAAVSLRKDIDIGSIKVSFDQKTRQPVAEVKNFCLRVRS